MNSRRLKFLLIRILLGVGKRLILCAGKLEPRISRYIIPYKLAPIYKLEVIEVIAEDLEQGAMEIGFPSLKLTSLLPLDLEHIPLGDIGEIAVSGEEFLWVS